MTRPLPYPILLNRQLTRNINRYTLLGDIVALKKAKELVSELLRNDRIREKKFKSGKFKKQKKTCKAGHRFTKENTYNRNKKGSVVWKGCRTCMRIWSRRNMRTYKKKQKHDLSNSL